MPPRKPRKKKEPNPWVEIRKLHKRMAEDGTPDEDDMQRFRSLVLNTPDAWSYASQVSAGIRDHLISKLTTGVKRAMLSSEVDILKRQFQYADSPPLERLLIDHIITTRIRLLHSEIRYSAMQFRDSYSHDSGIYWEKVLSLAHKRFLQAVEALAKVRKLSRSTPALQINIAREGGKQVNVQGDVNGQKTPSATDPQTGATP